MAEVSLRAITKSFGDVRIIKGVDLEIADGEFCVFVGPSGCGKSTLLRMIAGLEDITSGSLAIGGKEMADVEPADRGVAMVFQSYALYPHMTVRDNISFGLRMTGHTRADIEPRLKRAADMLQLTQLLDRKPSHSLAASASALPSGAPSCASLTCSCSTSRCLTLMQPFACRCAPRSASCTMISAPP